MNEIYQIFMKEVYDYPDEKGESITFLDLWEKHDNIIRKINRDFASYEMFEGDDICTSLKKNNCYKSFFDSLEENFSVELISQKTNQERGIYFPRIYRPVYSEKDSLGGRITISRNVEVIYCPFDNEHLIKSLTQLSTLVDFLNQIFKTVYPCPENYGTFGFDIRNLIILACTEFETHAIGVLKSNGINPKKDYYTTLDYVRLNDILKLSNYSVSFRHHPDLPSICPFNNWNPENPTKSLEWYNTYNKIKHDREKEFHNSRIQALVNSISACFVMLIAQYGELPIINEMLKNYWRVDKSPDWSMEEKYTKPYKDNNWIMKKYNG